MIEKRKRLNNLQIVRSFAFICVFCSHTDIRFFSAFGGGVYNYS